MENESWKDIPGWEGYYQASTQGRIRSMDRTVKHPRFGTVNRKGKVLSASPLNADGYLGVGLNRDGVKKKCSVHRLILETFIGPCPSGHEACHNNGDPTDNRLENLRWGTHSSNMLDQIAHGTNHWASRDRCSKGHLYTEDTVAFETAHPTKRVCKVCRREKDRRGYWKTKAERHPKQLNGSKTHCPRGHEYVEANTSHARGGKKRVCKACASARERAKRAGVPKEHFEELAEIFYQHNLQGSGRVLPKEIEHLVE